MICIVSWIGTYSYNVPYTCCSKYERFCLFCVNLNVNVNVDWNYSATDFGSPPLLPPSPLPPPPTPPLIKLGGPIAVNCSGIIFSI